MSKYGDIATAVATQDASWAAGTALTESDRATIQTEVETEMGEGFVVVVQLVEGVLRVQITPEPGE